MKTKLLFVTLSLFTAISFADSFSLVHHTKNIVECSESKNKRKVSGDHDSKGKKEAEVSSDLGSTLVGAGGDRR